MKQLESAIKLLKEKNEELVNQLQEVTKLQEDIESKKEVETVKSLGNQIDLGQQFQELAKKYTCVITYAEEQHYWA